MGDEKQSFKVERDGFVRDSDAEKRRSRRSGDRRDTPFGGRSRQDVSELQQGVLLAAIEGAAAAVDALTSTGRRVVDRSFSRDYRSPGDFVRNVGRDLDETARDLVDGITDAPRRMNDGFYDAVRPRETRANRGERWRRARDDEED